MMCVNSTLESQSAVERTTGLSREVLRKWEQRYQFPPVLLDCLTPGTPPQAVAAWALLARPTPLFSYF